MDILSKDYYLKRYKIKEKGRKWKFMPLAGRNKYSTTFGSTIYLTPDRWKSWQRQKPKGSTIALVAHEACHVNQAKVHKNFKKSYLTSRTDRLQWEAEAYALQAFIRVRLDKRGRNRKYFVDRYAKILNRKTYMLFKNYWTIRQRIDKEYQKLVERMRFSS